MEDRTLHGLSWCVMLNNKKEGNQTAEEDVRHAYRAPLDRDRIFGLEEQTKNTTRICGA